MWQIKKSLFIIYTYIFPQKNCKNVFYHVNNTTADLWYYFPNCVYPNSPCQLSLWEETGAPGENPRLSAERWLTLFTWVRSENRTHVLRRERRLLWRLCHQSPYTTPCKFTWFIYGSNRFIGHSNCWYFDVWVAIANRPTQVSDVVHVYTITHRLRNGTKGQGLKTLLLNCLEVLLMFFICKFGQEIFEGTGSVYSWVSITW
jgi:hypothetical protein